MPLQLAQSLHSVPSPTAARCLQCQLMGRRKALCSRRDACEALPLVFPLAPLLLAGWLALAIAFLVYVG
jgi:hypothetical protein